MVLARWQGTIVDDAGNVQDGASVTVRVESLGTPLASLFSDRDGLTPTGNPITADADGFAAFHVAGGAYQIVATKGLFTRTWRYVAVGNMAEQDSDAVDITGGNLSGVSLATIGGIDLPEITAPAAPGSNVARLYAVDDGNGVTTMSMKDSASNVVPLSHFLQSGSGAVMRTQHAKLRERVDARDFGVVGDGTTDDAAAINAGLAALGAAGGGVLEFPAGFNCRINSQVVNSYAGVTMRGVSGDAFHNVGTQVAPTRFTWGGATSPSTAMVLISSPFGASNKNLVGGGIENIMLDCARIKGIGLQVLSRRQLVVRNVFVLDATFAAFFFNCGVTGTDFGEDAGNQDSLFDRLSWRSIDDASVYDAHGIYGSGSSNANTSFNKFLNCDGLTQNGTGYFLENFDNNVMMGCRAFSLGTGLDFDLHGTTVGGSVGAAANYFIGCSWQAAAGKFTIRGTESGYLAATTDNIILTEDLGNSSSNPVLGTGAAVIRLSKGAALSVKGVTGNAVGKVQDIVAAANQVLRANAAGTALEFGAVDLTKAAAAVSDWTDYTPTFTSATGTLGTRTINRARYQQNGKRVHVYIDVSITSAGTTPGGTVRMTLPVTGFNAGVIGILSGYDLTTGNIIGGWVDGSNARASASFNAGVFAGGNGGRLLMEFTYEAA